MSFRIGQFINCLNICHHLAADLFMLEYITLCSNEIRQNVKIPVSEFLLLPVLLLRVDLNSYMKHLRTPPGFSPGRGYPNSQGGTVRKFACKFTLKHLNPFLTIKISVICIINMLYITFMPSIFIF